MLVSFPVSGVETYLWLPPLVAFVVSFVASMAGVSGAFLLLPFQMSVLGFTSPAVSPTNLVFNVVGIPAGVWRYIREGRMVWPLALTMLIASLPGVVVGGLLRLSLLPDPRSFKLFVASVLLYIGARLAWGGWRLEAHSVGPGPPSAREVQDWTVHVEHMSPRVLRFRFRGESHTCSPTIIAGLCILVGVVGGAYGVGGGALLAPILIGVMRLPVHAVAGATLLSTFGTSICGVLFYQVVALWYVGQGDGVAPDWLLGSLLGVGGLAGIYLGARVQRFVPARWLKLVLAALILYVASSYTMAFFPTV